METKKQTNKNPLNSQTHKTYWLQIVELVGGVGKMNEDGQKQCSYRKEVIWWRDVIFSMVTVDDVALRI